MAAEFADDSKKLIADVDCTAGGKSLCSEKGIRGYPTIKYGDPKKLVDYKGGREYQQLKDFVLANLGPKCSMEDLDACDAATRQLIDGYLAMPMDDLNKIVAEKQTELKWARGNMSKTVEAIQKQYETAAHKKYEAEDVANEADLQTKRTVLSFRQSSSADL